MPAYPGYDDISAWRRAQRTDGPRLAAGHATVASLLQSPPEYVEGHCVVCAAPARMRCAPTGGPGASLRESLRCLRCGANARQRAATALLLDGAPPGGRVYLTEQAGPFYRALRRRMPRLVGSEFARTVARRWRLQAGLWRHGVFERLRFADVTALPFRDRAFDAAMSLDVLEHVPDYRAALAEFARILRPGGRLVLTIPFHVGFECSEEVARILPDGQVEHLQVPEYHGDPLGGGVLCFHHFGWDLLDAMRAAGFASAEAVRVRDPALGLPEAVWVLRATR